MLYRVWREVPRSRNTGAAASRLLFSVGSPGEARAVIEQLRARAGRSHRSSRAVRLGGSLGGRLDRVARPPRERGHEPPGRAEDGRLSRTPALPGDRRCRVSDLRVCALRFCAKRALEEALIAPSRAVPCDLAGPSFDIGCELPGRQPCCSSSGFSPASSCRRKRIGRTTIRGTPGTRGSPRSRPPRIAWRLHRR